MNGMDTPMLSGDDNTSTIRPELVEHRPPAFVHLYSNGHYPSTAGSFQSNSTNFRLGGASLKSDKQQEEMFELIKTQCSNNPVLFQKIVDWGMQNPPWRGMSEEETNSLSDGRLWLVAQRLKKDECEEMITCSLDDIKGAYQRVGDSIWQQPDPEACGSDIQHRLCKNQYGRWVMWRRSLESPEWQRRAQEMEDGQWIDLKNNKMIIRVNIVPMSKILKRMGEEGLTKKNDLKKTMDFLFTSCNQAKLGKLKGRNLKHHIVNLKVKLEKRYALSFGIQIANTARSITER